MTTPQLISQTTLCAQAHPDRTLFELGDRSLTAAEFARRAQAVGAMLQAAGYSGQRVLIACPPGLDYIVGVLGALHAGAVAVPAYPPMRWVATLAANAADSGAKVALTTNGVAEALDRAALPEPLGQLDWVAIDDVDDPAGWIMPEVTSETLALLQYTSGSTGTPKGVMLTHGNLIAMSAAISALCEYDSASRRVDWLPPYHNTALIGSLLQAVYSGVPCVLLPTQAVLQDPGLWLRTISDRRATISGGPNFA